MWWDKLKKDIISTDLYTQSGTEVGASEGTLELEEKDGDYFPQKTSSDDIPEIAYSSSTDINCDYPALNLSVFGKLPASFLVGEYKKIYIGYFNDEEIRRNGASAGVITGIQNYLLENEMIDSAISLRMRKDKPYLTEPFLAKTKAEIMEGAQSKYITAPVNQILANLPDKTSRCVYTGLPHEIASIRKLQMTKHPSVTPIKYVLGIFYGEAIGFSAIKSFLRSHGVRDVTEVKSLAFRAGEWPGHMRVELKNGRVISVRKFHANYLIPSHITPFSLYQIDYMSELADISVGDAWAPTYEQRGQGWSVVIARSNKGLELVEKMRQEKKLTLKEIDFEELLQMHSHGLDLKKRGAFIRIENRKQKGLPVPDYGYLPINIPIQRQRFEFILGILFKIFQHPITIWTLEHLPIPLIGWFFIKARNIWKKRTKKTKKGGLRELEFEITSPKLK